MKLPVKLGLRDLKQGGCELKLGRMEIRLPFHGRSASWFFWGSAVLAALIASVLLVNYVVMPIVVRRGDLVAAPDLVGRSRIEAERVAEDAGLSVRVVSERSDPVYPLGHVISQSPLAGVDIKRRRTMGVILSAGLDVKTVPALVGLSERQAGLEAEEAGLSVSEYVEIHTDDVGKGRVVATCPEQGATVPAGGGIRVLVSRGPRPLEFIMPNLVGKTPDDARRVAEALGLVVRSVKHESGRGRLLRDVVTVQEPAPGSRVIEGEGVALRVGNG